MSKKFVLCLGHQKCGTTWLHAYLSRSPLFEGGVLKEYHVWDALDCASMSQFLAKPTLKSRLGLGRRSASYIRYRMQKQPEFYFGYFSSLYGNGVGISGDFTPSYSALKADRIKYICAEFQSRGVDVLPVILLRDPLRRIKSAVRFNLDRENYKEGIESGEVDFENALRQYYRSEHCVLRTGYQAIISEAEQVFGREKIHIGLYENMFEPEQIETLSRFIGIEAAADFAKVKVNKTKSAVSETALDAEIRDFYSDVYSYCSREFPETQRLWQ